MARRVQRLSTTFRRTLAELGVRSGSKAYRALFATLNAMETSDLPGPGDHETTFSPGRVFVRRVAGHNLWLLYRFDSNHLFVMSARDQPPVPIDE